MQIKLLLATPVRSEARPVEAIRVPSDEIIVGIFLQNVIYIPLKRRSRSEEVFCFAFYSVRPHCWYQTCSLRVGDQSRSSRFN